MSDKILEKAKTLRLDPRIKKAVLIPIGVAAFAYTLYLGYDWFFPKKTEVAVEQQQQASNSRTAFDGLNTNQSDPLAGKTYCKDLSDYAKSIDDRSKLKDICVLESIANDWLPTMTDEQMADMAANDPGCFETGFGKDGFNCFTGFDKNNCGRNGLDKDGKECVPVSGAESPLQALDKNKICDLVSGCVEKTAFNHLGVNEFGCNRQGRMEDGSVCPIEYLTPIYGSDNLDQAGFSPKGFNKHGCDRKGFREDGSACPIDQVTRVYGRDKKDQFGFYENGLNDKGCNIHGLTVDGLVCDPKDITRVYVNGKDQFNLDKSGFNDKNCNLEGFKPDGVACDLSDMPRIFGKDGFDQNKLRQDGRNEFHCDLNGKKPDGSSCSVEETPLVFDPQTGKSQFGLFKDGRNEFGCDIHHRKPDGTMCAPSERAVGSIINPSNRPGGVDLLEPNGRNKFGCNIQGLDASGKHCPSHHIPRVYNGDVDQFGIKADGFNDKGCSLDGLRRDGSVCPFEDIPRIKDKNNVDQFGFGEPPYNAAGCDFKGLKRDGSRCDWKDVTKIVGLNGVTQFGVGENGVDSATGCDISTGRRLDGSWCQYDDIKKWRDAKGFDQFDLDIERRNELGCNPEGRRRDGSLCAAKDVPLLPGSEGFTADHRTFDGTSRTGFKNGYNEYGCDVEGKREDGTLCPIEQITRVYNQGLDQFGLRPDGTNKAGCLLTGLRKDGTACDVKDITVLRGNDGKNQFESEPQLLSGYLSASKPLLDNKGNTVTINGKPVKVSPDGTLVDAETGVPVIDANGEMLEVSSDGKIKTKSGGKPAATISSIQKKPLSGSAYDAGGVSALVNSDGKQLMLNGKPVGVNKEGQAVDMLTGKVILGSDGKPLTMNSSGALVDAAGKEMALTTADKVPHKGPAFVSSPSGALVDADGEPVLVNGRKVFTSPDGSVRYADTGESVRDPKTGELLYLSPNGDFVTSAGEKSSLDPSEKVTVSSDGPGPLVGADGPVLVDGRAVGVDKQNRIIDLETGKPVVDKNGEPLVLKDGKILTSSGKKPEAMISSLSESSDPIIAAKDRPSSDMRSGAMKKPLSGSVYDAGGVSALVNSDGKQLMLNGKPVGVNKEGQAVDMLTGKVILGSDGKPLTMNSSGALVDAAGKEMALTTADKVPHKGPAFVSSPSGALVDADGEPVLVNGRKVFTSPDGSVRYADTGESVRDPKTGELLYLSPNGDFVTSAGKKSSLDPSEKVTVSSDGPGPLVGADGPVLVDGRAVGVDKQNRIIDLETGKPVVDKNGEPLVLKDGKILTSSGKKPDAAISSLSDASVKNDSVKGRSDVATLLNGGVNEKGCLLTGFKLDGSRCALKDIPRIRTADGADQFGVFENGRNAFGCGFDGKREDGTQCPLEKTPRIIGADKLDQFGIGPDGRNIHGCDVNHKKPDGTLCPASEQIKSFETKESDVNRLDSAGFNPKGCNISGFRRDGTRCDLIDIPRIFTNGYDQFNLDIEGRNKAGCGLDGKKEDGSLCPIKDIPLILNPETKEDQFGMVNGKNKFGCDLHGYKQDGSLCPSEQRTRIYSDNMIDQFGVSKITGMNSHGCNEQNLDHNGHVCKPEQTIRFMSSAGVDQDGLNAELRNKFDCDVNGLMPDGSVCKPEHITRVVLDKQQKTDQFGLDAKTGKNSFGCGLDGLDASGRPCDYSKIPLIVGQSNEDQFGINQKTGVNVNGCSILGVKADGSSCDPKESPMIMGTDGFSQLNYDREFYNREGYSFQGYDIAGCDANNNKADSSPCSKYRPLALDHDDNAYIDERERIVSQLIIKYQENSTVKESAGKGTYDYSAIKAAESAAISQKQAAANAVVATASAEKAADKAQNTTGADGIPEIPVGMMLIVEVQTPVNSDYTEDVYGKIVGSELDGMTVKGTINVPFLDNVVMPRDKFQYVFKELIYNRKSYPIDAISVNLDNDSGMVSADDVEYHRWQRYSGLLVASAVQALDASFLDSQEEKALRQQAELLGSAQSAQLYAQNTESLTKQNLKTATSYVSGIAKEQFFRRPTIKKGGFTHQLIVFRSEVDNEKLPMVFSEEEY